jgi:hypothetical protein
VRQIMTFDRSEGKIWVPILSLLCQASAATTSANDVATDNVFFVDAHDKGTLFKGSMLTKLGFGRKKFWDEF